MKKNNLNFLILILALVALFTSCKKEDVTDDPSNGNSMEQLNVDPSFNWSTTTNYTLNLTGYANSVVKVVSTDNIIYHQSMMVRNTAVPVTITLPSYLKKVNLVYMGISYEVELSSTTINFTF